MKQTININILPFGTSKVVIDSYEQSDFEQISSEPIYTEIKTTDTPFLSLEIDDFLYEVSPHFNYM